MEFSLNVSKYMYCFLSTGSTGNANPKRPPLKIRSATFSPRTINFRITLIADPIHFFFTAYHAMDLHGALRCRFLLPEASFGLIPGKRNAEFRISNFVGTPKMFSTNKFGRLCKLPFFGSCLNLKTQGIRIRMWLSANPEFGQLKRIFARIKSLAFAFLVRRVRI